MTHAVQFLEALACTPVEASGEVIQAMLGDVELQPDVREALLARDADALARLLGARASMVCSVAMPEDDAPLEDDKQPDGDEDEPPPQSTVRAA